MVPSQDGMLMQMLMEVGRENFVGLGGRLMHLVYLGWVGKVGR